MNTVLKDISFCIHDGDKAGIVGVNGAGKSTLLNIINGELQCDSGTMNISKGYKIGFLHQNTGLDTDNTIFNEMLSVYEDLINKEIRLKELEKEISSKASGDGLELLMKEYSKLSDEYSLKGGYEYRSRVKGVLKGLGFNEEQFDIKIHILSGGQKTRLALAKLLLSEPDIMLLDEPTNHLDIEAIMWLEGFLKTMKKTVLIVSHDRYFLDSVTTKTLELENNSAKLYNGNYTHYIKQKEIDREIQQRHYENQQREIEKMEAFIAQQKQWNRERNIIAAESRQKAIDRIEKIEKPKDLPGKINIKFRKSIISGNDVMFVENLAKSYPGKKLFSDISFKLRKNERVFLLGPNGCGKSTLVKILVSKLLADSGVVEFGHKVKVGYYDQELQDLDESKTILEELIDSDSDLTLTQIRTLLSSFLFKGEDVLKPISALSGGERSRVALAKLILSSSNFLILDEPTNHLDINSREILEDALINYEGTILSISHDRYFINKLASRILDLDACSLLDCEGNYDFFIDYKNKIKKSPADASIQVQVSQSKLDYKAEKEERARIRKLEKRYSEIETKIAEIESRLKDIEQEMFDESTSSDHSKLTELLNEQTSLKSLLEELYSEWEKITVELGL
jgi:ATP-binding cassette subfamily F protein 3